MLLLAFYKKYFYLLFIVIKNKIKYIKNLNNIGILKKIKNSFYEKLSYKTKNGYLEKIGYKLRSKSHFKAENYASIAYLGLFYWLKSEIREYTLRKFFLALMSSDLDRYYLFESFSK